MTEGREVLAVIPARSGSRRLPGKNIRPLLGKPLMAWMIDAARHAQRVSRVIVSTDSEEYAAIGRACGADTPFLRPGRYATDEATDLDVLTHAVSWLQEQEGYQPEVVVRLQPTNPTFPARLIDEGIALLLEDAEADSVRPIAPTPKHPCKMWRYRDGSSYIEPFWPSAPSGQEQHNLGYQQLPPVYVQVGAMEVVRYDTLMRQRSMAGGTVRGLVVDDPLYTVNIDTELDFALAELALREVLERQVAGRTGG